MRPVLFVFVIWLCLCSVVRADVVLLKPKDSESYTLVANEIQRALVLRGIDPSSIQQLLVSDWLAKPNTADLLIPIGPSAAQKARGRQHGSALIYTFVEESFIRKLEQENKRNNWVAVVINQPLQRFVSLANLLFQGRPQAKLLIANSNSNALVNEQIKSVNSADNIQIVHRPIEAGQREISRLEEDFYQASALIAPLDKKLWQGKNARLLLHQAYNYKIPVIAHSRSFTKAGAMLALYADRQQVAKETAALAYEWKAANSFGRNAIVYPKARIVMNKNIAKALRFKVSELERALTQEELSAKFLGRRTSAR